MSRYVKMHKVQEDTDIVGIRKMEAKDVPIVHKKLNAFLNQFKLHIQFTQEEVAHFMIPRENVIEAYVVEDPETKQITDFISFYSLPSSILRHPDYNTLYVAYQFYYFTDKYTITQLQRNANILAKQKNYDVFNALDIHNNSEFFEELKFGVGDGNLHYYLYNWRVNKLNPGQCGITLV